MRLLSILLTVAMGLIAIVWLGLQVQPTPFATFPQTTGKLETVPLPVGLPAPVERFYRTVYGDRIPLITSAVITGEATIRPIAVGPAFPARFRFTHEAGRNYRHYIEATWFGFPIMRVNETYLDGKSRQEMPWGTTENSAKANQAANLGMWAETMSMPAVFLTDSRVRWEAVDDATAMLVVPFGESQERFVVRFDLETNLVRWMEVMRYKGSEANANKILWITESLPEKTITVSGITLNAMGSATWLDDGKPWAFFTNKEVIYNVDVQEYVRARGL
jgi:hypothetical protein